MELSAIRILASVLLVQCCCSQKEETFPSSAFFKNEVGHRDERCPLINPKVAKLLPHEDECTSYYICESGFAILRECPDNLHFNPTKLVCDFADRAGCELDQSPPRLRADTGFLHPDCPAKNPKKPVLLPDPSDCGRFYICDGGVAHPKTCMAGLHFNPKVQVCDFPQNVDCGTEDDGVHSNLHPVKSKSGKGGGDKEETGFPSPFCPLENGKFPIFYRHPTDCSMYYMCGNGLAYRFTCPAKLYFDERRKVCDLPFRVRCQVNV